MKKLLILPIAIIGIFAFTINSCKKAKKETCKIQRVTQTGGSNDVYLLTYDDNFKLTKINNGSIEKNFFYGNNQKTILTTDGGTFSSKVIITYNGQQQIINARTETNASGTNWENNSLTYSGGHPISLTTTSSSASSNTFNLIWENGNLIKVVPSSGTATNFDYYTDKDFQDADYLSLIYTLQSFGESLFINKNLIKKFSTQEINYNFNDKGLISSLSISPSISTLNIDYICK